MKELKKQKSEKMIEYPPYKCKCCGMGDIEKINDICKFCGWEDDGLQNINPDYEYGANHMSLNQYKEFWEENKEEILKVEPLHKCCFVAIAKAKEYFAEHFKEKHDQIMKKAETNRQKRELEKQKKELYKEEKEKPDYDYEKNLKKLKIVRGEFKQVGKYGMPLFTRRNRRTSK